MSSFAQAMLGNLAQSPSNVKFVTVGGPVSDNVGFRTQGTPIGSLAFNQQVMNQSHIITDLYSNDSGGGFYAFDLIFLSAGAIPFTSITVEDWTGAFRTLLKSAAVAFNDGTHQAYEWDTSGVGPMWIPATVGLIKRVYFVP